MWPKLRWPVLAMCFLSLSTCATLTETHSDKAPKRQISYPTPQVTYCAKSECICPICPEARPPEAKWTIYEGSFAKLPGWSGANYSQALLAFQKSCHKILTKKPEALLSKRAPYGGRARDWQSVCLGALGLKSASPTEARDFFEASFAPVLITSEKGSKLTGYYEPEIAARKTPSPGFEAAIPAVPADMQALDLGYFDKNFGARKVWGRVKKGKFERYPARKDIKTDPKTALGFMDAGELFFMQIQGSGRLILEDGSRVRAAFAAHNHHPYKSLGRHLIHEGIFKPNEASAGNIKKWLQTVSDEEAQAAMNINPRFVFFQKEEIKDLSEGPKGAAAIPLTPMASMAVDLEHHPLNIPFFISTKLPQVKGDWRGIEKGLLVISQDTGGAIRGKIRGDLFFGSGAAAGDLAGVMNHEMQMWALLPHDMISMEISALASSINGA